MTSEQHARWKDFALRMARLPSRRPPTAWVVEMVQWWFDLNDHPQYDIADVTCWDQGEALVCDRVSEFLWDRSDEHFSGRGPDDYDRRELAAEHWLGTWGNAVSCCIRAGLDVVAEPSMGVLGFTVGDLRRMYPEGLPEWLDKGQLATAGNDEGVWL